MPINPAASLNLEKFSRSIQVFPEDKDLVALISDASIDFTPSDFDSPLNARQRAYLKEQCGRDIPQLFWRRQVHGDDVLVARDGVKSVMGCPDADAYITHEKNLPIAIRTADCVPVLMLDPLRHAIGLAHAGWKGTYRMIAYKTVQNLQEKFNSQITELKVYLGPSIRECCYEVGVEFRQYFPAHVHERGGHLYADVVGANRDQLIKAGVRPENIQDSGICTSCNKNYFSYRRDGEKSGRMVSLMMLV